MISKCHTTYCLVYYTKYKSQKDEHMRTERKKIWKGSKSNKVGCFNIYIFVFVFLSRTIEEDR